MSSARGAPGHDLNPVAIRLFDVDNRHWWTVRQGSPAGIRMGCSN